MKWTLYHGTTESRFLNLRAADNKFTHSDGEKHLLGTGIYLYEDPIHARVWANQKARYENDKPFIIAADIEMDVDNYVDLDYRQPQDWFFEQRELYRQRYLVLKQRKDARISYYTDSHFCNFLYDRFPVKMFSKTFVHVRKQETDLEVRYTNQKDTDRNVTRHFRTEKQYCLKDDSRILEIREWKEV